MFSRKPMNPIISKLLAPRHMEYLTLSADLKIVELSPTIAQFADSPQHVLPGQDVRLGFPEITGSEEILHQVYRGQVSSFKIEGIERSSQPNPPLYISLYILEYKEDYPADKRLLLLVENVTEVMTLRQSLVQRASEAELLLSALTASQDYNNKILFGMGDPLFVTTASGKIKTVNLAAQNLFGYTEGELIGQPISTLITDLEYLAEIATNLPLESWRSLPKLERICQTKLGNEVVIELSCAPIQTEVRNLYDLVYIGRDITERKKAEIEIKRALQKERELNELKSRFIKMVSHEFRTPITTIISTADLLRLYGNNYSETEKLEYFKLIQEAANAINHLIEDVLVLERTDIDNLQFNPRPFELGTFCHDLLRELQVSDRGKHSFQFNALGEPLQVVMDRDLLRCILSNLLSNAIKYSPINSEIQLTLLNQEPNVVFEICDRGIGIAPQNQPYLFDSFYRGQNVGQVSGTGLGLTIVEQAVKVHRGRIILSSELGKGTTFRVTLPMYPLNDIGG